MTVAETFDRRWLLQRLTARVPHPARTALTATTYLPDAFGNALGSSLAYQSNSVNNSAQETVLNEATASLGNGVRLGAGEGIQRPFFASNYDLPNYSTPSYSLADSENLPRLETQVGELQTPVAEDRNELRARLRAPIELGLDGTPLKDSDESSFAGKDVFFQKTPRSLMNGAESLRVQQAYFERAKEGDAAFSENIKPIQNVVNRFLSGAGNAALGLITEPIGLVADNVQLWGYTLPKYWLTGQLDEPRNYLSNAANAYNAGESKTSIVAGYVPVVGAGIGGYQLGSALYAGDYEKASELAGGLTVGIASMRLGERAVGPEPGARFGVKQLGTELPYDIVDSAGISGGKLPPLPADKTNTFNGMPVPREFGSGELSRIYQAGNPDAALEGRYWATEIPASEARWRGFNSVLKDWGNAGTDVATLQRASTWTWYGETAAMAVQNGHSFQVGNYAIGWYQPGGRPQAMIPNSYSTVKPSNVTTTRTPWSKP
ncbi:MAG: hypothetical protein IPN64_06155 [Propionivibrio sp.]|uniref:hypothetical protein n=1 Tax=Propionivibrio sp. TaxID=2212460 RepID=UPI0025DC2428|nr:hypothetical protein [Propionivibrio sp.]MBK7355645.1 hypothetical protein [Propionivibrio sp.]MBK8893639.1 hypothetical protein [Propionivibrio sp.]